MSNPTVSPRRRAAAKTPEARENQMIALAIDVAEQQMRAGTASSQIISHYLKLATQREQKELEMIERKNELLRAQHEAIDSGKRIEELYGKALSAMREYRGMPEVDEE